MTESLFHELKQGENEISWFLDEEGCLTIEGSEESGKMPDCGREDHEGAPWLDDAERIVEVHFEEGITEIGIRTFSGCKNLRRIVLPESLWKIHGYAFYGCDSLEEVIASDRPFRYLYAPVIDSRNEITFGIGAFYRTPWALKEWGDYYSVDEILYCCFSGSSHLQIPEGIRTLHTFALANTDAETVTLPQGLRSIENFAFTGTRIDELVIPESVDSISEYAFSGSSLRVIEFPSGMAELPALSQTECMEFKTYNKKKVEEKPRSKGKPKKRYYYETMVEMPDLYRVVTKSGLTWDVFQKLLVQRKNTQNTKNPCYGRNHVDVGESIYRRIRCGSAIIGIITDQDRVSYMQSYKWDEETESVTSYCIEPVLEDTELQLTVTEEPGLDKDDIKSFFVGHIGRDLAQSGELGFDGGGDHQEWYRASDGQGCGGDLEAELLELWLENNPEKGL